MLNNREKLISLVKKYNKLLYSMPEMDRCTLISTILLALHHEEFCYQSCNYTSILVSCEEVLKSNNLSENALKIVMSEYQKVRIVISNDELINLVTQVKEQLLPYQGQLDVIGELYTQICGGDKKAGIVLTPTHITQFFCEVANLTANDTVFDCCCGTGSFLIASMRYTQQIIGIEKRADMFAIACSNLRGSLIMQKKRPLCMQK